MNPALPTPAQLAAARVLVVGDAMLDRYWFGHVDRISPEAPVPVVRVTREEVRLGGAANVALNVKTLGAPCTLLTVVGDDGPGRELDALLRRHGVEAVLGTDAQLMTVVKLRVIGRSQQLLRVDFENKPDHEVLQQMLADYERRLPAHGLVLLSDYGKGGLTHVASMIERARAAGRPVLVDPKGSDFSRYAGATAITPNRSELAQVVGAWSDEADLERRAQALRAELALDGLLLTRSEEGISLFDAGGHLRLATEAREVYDVTGAGDTVIGALAALMAAGLSLRDAAVHANRAAGIVVSRFGTAAVKLAELAP
ncbi:MAG: D-glycero-beta-D-manno-heptose-7-phosphate kinase [Burkholderiales bacterium]|nr:D-glycero-beta-D-manno-heptose-7-phosphate kinase [Burkholderiales bacterium]MDE1929701.1 D-glycero-beta-D-manno-heptose-7-phosphate kinase [Burkholderiales bacterium]MDE2160876.1 D-glycero-beta-D-manno-heptose-7-phosphate kinase [Burkholderiales bacterium]MDE2504234.1 D-glycero-beta-D-manno-heptose-7-phosphate kinase [Burkholderiales bacterium]